jgi:energy-coupling factor transport system substrate-specific component
MPKGCAGKTGGSSMVVIKNPLLRKWLKILLPFIIIPAAIGLGFFIPAGKRYIYITLAVSLLTVLLFASGYESKRIGSRRLIVSAVFISLSVAGRFIPLVKPVASLTVIAGVHLGSETGFFIGAMSAVLSNFYFGQGPWTPYQMLSLGLIGFFAGLLPEKIKKSRIWLSIFGFIAGVVYSLIMDVWTVMWYSGEYNIKLYISALIYSLPFTALYALSNAGFVYLLAKPFGDKLNRIKMKYGL